jgi:2,4-dienoyl-CoA reductase-like NADH-dependent reductase (Old Yellow Enzyme family)
MEGWDAHTDGSPSEHTLRRWRRFGESGAKWIWGGEAAAVEPDGRANPNQTLATAGNLSGVRQLFDELRAAHHTHHGTTDDLFVGLQLTHSGRFARPTSAGPQPRVAYHHPVLDRRVGIAADDDAPVLSDDAIERLIDDYVKAAGVAQEAGFEFVDIKACHGYLLHEFLSAHTRRGPYGGDFEGRTRLLRTIIARVRDACPGLHVAVRLSAFDTVPYETAVLASGKKTGQPADYRGALPYVFGFGVNQSDPLMMDLSEPIRLVRRLGELCVVAVNVSCGSPYYNPHIQRPAIFPPSDGYPPPEDPLVGVCRQIHAARDLKQAVPEMVMVGTGYTYLQDYLPHVAQAVVRNGWIDSVGLGRMVLSYSRLPADTLDRGLMDRKSVCRTFSDCTTAPRNGLVSGCFPLDGYYKALPEAVTLKALKAMSS